MLAGACWFVTAAFPLSAAPQAVTDAAGVSVDTQGAHLMHRSPVKYPRDAQIGGIEGIVLAQVKLDANGNVSDASILSGPDQLRKPVLQSLLSWHFTKDAAGSTRQIVVTFHLPDPKATAAPQSVPVPQVVNRVAEGTAILTPSLVAGSLGSTPSAAPVPGSPRTIRQITVTGLDIPEDEVLSKLSVHVNDEWRPELMAKLIEDVQQIDEHLHVAVTQLAPNSGIILRISGPVAPPPPPPLPRTTATAPPSTERDPRWRPGAEHEAHLRRGAGLSPDAKAARISGTVELAALIGPDGHIQQLSVVTGHPLLRQAALDAVKQWIYSPTLLNEQPVSVSTTIDVIFSLSQ